MQDNFKIGSFYKIQDIRGALGGPLLASIATKNNRVLYVKFKAEKSNPNLPNEIWIKNGPIQLKSALSWVHSGEKVPFFFKNSKQGSSDWKYLGNFSAGILHKGVDAEMHSKNKDIALVLTILNYKI